MNTEIQSIGSFQLENLIKARVPFLFVRENFEIESSFGVMEKIHIRNFSILVDKLDYASLEPFLQERKTRFEDPIVVMDTDGTNSQQLVEVLTAKGFINVFFVIGGWNAVKTELS